MLIAPASLRSLINPTTIQLKIESGGDLLSALSSAKKSGDEHLHENFYHGTEISQLVTGRAWMIDTLLRITWLHFIPANAPLNLIAVGGFGRGELHPYSDIDLLILTEEEPSQFTEQLSCFISCCWDLKLTLGHSVRSQSQCVEDANADITLATALMESRLIAGKSTSFNSMLSAVGPENIWPGKHFFEAKLEEQFLRHQKFNETAYKLEPNVKEGPGCLRDIQTIGWVAKRHYHAKSLHHLIHVGFLDEDEYHALNAGQLMLWKIRFGLHTLASRAEDRLLFGYQLQIANLFAFNSNNDNDNDNEAIEQFMQSFYRTIMQLERLNERLLQLYHQDMINPEASPKKWALNEHFNTYRNYIEVSNKQVFEKSPSTLLELFLIIQKNKHIIGVRASTIRLIRKSLHLIDSNFRNSKEAQTIFMAILKQKNGVYEQLSNMNRYGILAAYLPEFGKIVGRMQHDLFHIYTVDQHTLFVIRNLLSFFSPAHNSLSDECQKLALKIHTPELLYIVGLYHDIAKGRGGDHSELGAFDARVFCQNHRINTTDTNLIVWLVKNHLIMSVTAQRKDTSDPDIVHQFACEVGDLLHLNYLYLLTVADISATSPKLWTNWKSSLLSKLYTSTRYALRRGLNSPIDKETRIHDIKKASRQKLYTSGLSLIRTKEVWDKFPDDYFLRSYSEQIVSQTLAIAGAEERELPLVLVQRETDWGTTEVFVYAADKRGYFAAVTATLENLRLSVVEARIITSLDGYSANTFQVLNATGHAIDSQHGAHELRAALKRHLSNVPVKISRYPTRHQKHFAGPGQIIFRKEPINNRTFLEIICTDRPGLLSSIGQAFIDCGIKLHEARIATFGARVEDFFLIENSSNQALTEPEEVNQLKHALANKLELEIHTTTLISPGEVS